MEFIEHPRTAALACYAPIVMKVAVVIPVFNGAKTVSRAIKSALSQGFQSESEIIVVNDGSTDLTGEVLARYQERRMRIINQPNRGPAAARNAAVASSKAEYLAFLDADDFFMPKKIQHSVAHLETNRRAVMLFHDAAVIDVEGHELPGPFVTPSCAHAPSMQEMLTRWWPIVPSTAVIRRSVFDACGGFDEAFKSAAYEDPYLWIRAREWGEFIYFPQRLASYTMGAAAARAEKYLDAQNIFLRRIEERYGRTARKLIRNTRRAYANAMAYEGLQAMSAGNHAMARRYLVRALVHQPASPKNAFRLVRSFLPARIVRSLSGRTVHDSGPRLKN